MGNYLPDCLKKSERRRNDDETSDEVPLLDLVEDQDAASLTPRAAGAITLEPHTHRPLEQGQLHSLTQINTTLRPVNASSLAAEPKEISDQDETKRLEIAEQSQVTLHMETDVPARGPVYVSATPPEVEPGQRHKTSVAVHVSGEDGSRRGHSTRTGGDGGSGTGKLTLSSLATVRDALFDVRSKWEDIGIELLSKNDTDAIKKEKCNNVVDCLTEMLTVYLKRAKPEPSWRSIIAALKANAVGESQKAKELEEEYLSQDQAVVSSPLRQLNAESASVDHHGNSNSNSTDREILQQQNLSLAADPDGIDHFPYLDTSTLSSHERKDLIQRLSRDYKNILTKFATLQTSTCKSLNERNISTEMVANCALTLAVYKSDDVPQPLLPEEQDLLEEAKSIERIFFLLRRHKLISYFDYGILKLIIETHGSEDDKRRLTEYVDEFQAFCRRRVVEVPPMISECTSSTRKVFKVLITADMSATLADIEAAERKIADILGLAHSVLILHKITLGSLVLTLSIPITIADKVFPLQASQLSRLEVNGFTLLCGETGHSIRTGEDGGSGTGKTGHSTTTKRKHKIAIHKRQPALTVDNILKELKQVKWETLRVHVLLLPPSQLCKIEEKYAAETERKREGVKYWLWNCPYASWRMLITQLDWKEEHAVADQIRGYAEKLTELTMTSDNVSKVVTTVGEDDLRDVLVVPWSKREEFRQQSSTTADYRQNLLDYFIKYSHWAGWSDLASRLYRYEQPTAVEAARAFITQTPEPSLSLTNLTTLLENVNVGDSRQWWYSGIFLNIPGSKLYAIEGQHSSPDQCSRACWDLYLSDHPSPSWKGVAYALYTLGHLEELEVVQKKYLNGGYM